MQAVTSSFDIIGGLDLGLVWACAVCRMPAFDILELAGSLG